MENFMDFDQLSSTATKEWGK